MNYAVNRSLFKKVRNDPQLESIGNKVTQIRQTAKGELLFPLKKGVNGSGALLQKESHVLGSNVELRT